MKILHVIPSVSPVRGGPSHAVLEMVWQLRHQGIDAAIATTNDDGDGLLDVKLQQWVDYPVDSASRAFVSVSTSASTSASTNIKNGDRTIPIRFFPRFSPASDAIREFTFSFALTRWLFQHMRDYDLIHIHAVFSYPAVIAMILARLLNVPYIVRPLGSLAHWSLQQGAQKKADVSAPNSARTRSYQRITLHISPRAAGSCRLEPGLPQLYPAPRHYTSTSDTRCPKPITGLARATPHRPDHPVFVATPSQKRH